MEIRSSGRATGHTEVIVGILGLRETTFVTGTVLIQLSSGRKPDQKRGSNKGHKVMNLEYSYMFVGCHLRRKIVECAASHEAVNRRVVVRSRTGEAIVLSSFR